VQSGCQQACDSGARRKPAPLRCCRRCRRRAGSCRCWSCRPTCTSAASRPSAPAPQVSVAVTGCSLQLFAVLVVLATGTAAMLLEHNQNHSQGLGIDRFLCGTAGCSQHIVQRLPTLPQCNAWLSAGQLQEVKVGGGRQRDTHWLRRRHPARGNSTSGAAGLRRWSHVMCHDDSKVAVQLRVAMYICYHVLMGRIGSLHAQPFVTRHRENLSAQFAPACTCICARKWPSNPVQAACYCASQALDGSNPPDELRSGNRY
jgi:hypothetical protein